MSPIARGTQSRGSRAYSSRPKPSITEKIVWKHTLGSRLDPLNKERTQNMSRMYNNQISRLDREAEQKRKTEADKHAVLHDKHAAQKSAMEARHHQEGKKHRHDFREI